MTVIMARFVGGGIGRLVEAFARHDLSLAEHCSWISRMDGDAQMVFLALAPRTGTAARDRITVALAEAGVDVATAVVTELTSPRDFLDHIEALRRLRADVAIGAHRGRGERPSVP